MAKRFLVPETLRRELMIKGVIKRQGGYQMFKTESYAIKDAAALMPQVSVLCMQLTICSILVNCREQVFGLSCNLKMFPSESRIGLMIGAPV